MKTFLRVLWLISGILLIACGIYVLFHPTQTLLSIAALLGSVMLFSGIFSVAAYCTQKSELFGANWILFDGILDIVLGVLLLIYPVSAFVASVFLMLMSLWIIFKGVTVILNASAARKFDSGWYLLLIVGIVLTLFGILSLFKPIVAAVTISIILGVFLISDGIEITARWWMVRKFRKNLGL